MMIAVTTKSQEAVKSISTYDNEVKFAVLIRAVAFIQITALIVLITTLSSSIYRYIRNKIQAWQAGSLAGRSQGEGVVRNPPNVPFYGCEDRLSLKEVMLCGVSERDVSEIKYIVGSDNILRHWNHIDFDGGGRACIDTIHNMLYNDDYMVRLYTNQSEERVVNILSKISHSILCMTNEYFENNDLYEHSPYHPATLIYEASSPVKLPIALNVHLASTNSMKAITSLPRMSSGYVLPHRRHASFVEDKESRPSKRCLYIKSSLVNHKQQHIYIKPFVKMQSIQVDELNARTIFTMSVQCDIVYRHHGEYKFVIDEKDYNSLKSTGAL